MSRLHYLLCIQRARDEGLIYYAQALVELYRKEYPND